MTDIDEIMGFFGIRGANVIDMRTLRINPIELSEFLWGNLPKHEKRANRDFLIGVFKNRKDWRNLDMARDWSYVPKGQ